MLLVPALKVSWLRAQTELSDVSILVSVPESSSVIILSIPEGLDVIRDR